MHIQPMFRVMAGLAVTAILHACSSAPPGKDLVQATCQCNDGCSGNAVIGLPGAVCTDASVKENVDTALNSLCRGKETIGYNICKIHSCVPTMPNIIQGGCPERSSGKFKTGDFGQTLATALAPSNIIVSGGDIYAFTIAPQSFTISTTQNGSNLDFTYIHGSLGTTIFTFQLHKFCLDWSRGGLVEPPGT